MSGSIGWGAIVGHNQRMAVHRGNQLSFCQFASGGERTVALPNEQPSHATVALHVDVHPNGRLVVESTAYGIRLTDSVEGRELVNLKLGFTQRSMFSQNGTSLITNHDSTITVWPLSFDGSGLVTKIGPPHPARLPKRPVGHGPKSMMRIGSAGKVFLLVTEASKFGPFKTWIVDSNMTGQFRETSVTDTILAVGPEGRLIAHRVDGNRIGVTDTRFQEVVFTLPKMPLTNVFFSVNGEVLFAIGDNMLLAFSMPDGKLLYDLGDIDIAWPTSFSNNSRLAILSLRRPAGFLLVEAKTGRKLAHFPVADDAVPRNLATVFAAGQSRIVSFGRGNEILSWDLKAIKEQLKSFHLDWSSEELALKEVWEVPRSSSIQVDWGGQRRKFLDNLIHGEHALDRTRIELLNRLLEEDAGDVDCLFVRAEAHRQLGHIDLAREDVAKALEISPDDEALKRLQVRLGEVP